MARSSFVFLLLLLCSGCGEGMSAIADSAKLPPGGTTAPMGSSNFQGATEQALGFYSKGGLTLSNQLPAEGFGIVALKDSRTEQYGTVDLIQILFYAAAQIAKKFPEGERLQVNDMSLASGGTISGHASHQNGLDADVFYYRKDHKEMLSKSQHLLEMESDEALAKVDSISANLDISRSYELVSYLVGTGRVSRIFVTAAIKKAFCAYAKSIGQSLTQNEALRRLSPNPEHASHMHVRIFCPFRSPSCVNQLDPPPGTGC